MGDIQYEIQSDGRTVWVHSSEGHTVARFGANGIDVHTADSSGCIDCTHGPTALADWELFVASVNRHYGVHIGAVHRPTRFLGAPMTIDPPTGLADWLHHITHDGGDGMPYTHHVLSRLTAIETILRTQPPALMNPDLPAMVIIEFESALAPPHELPESQLLRLRRDAVEAAVELLRAAYNLVPDERPDMNDDEPEPAVS